MHFTWRLLHLLHKLNKKKALGDVCSGIKQNIDNINYKEQKLQYKEIHHNTVRIRANLINTYLAIMMHVKTVKNVCNK